MTDNASRAAEAAWYFAPSGIPHDGFVAGFTAGAAWSREQSAAKPAKRHSYARQLRDAERSVVEAALRWREDGGVNALSIMRYSCTKLLALRAAAGKPDAG